MSATQASERMCLHIFAFAEELTILLRKIAAHSVSYQTSVPKQGLYGKAARKRTADFRHLWYSAAQKEVGRPMFELHGRINRVTYWEALIDGLAFVVVVLVGIPWALLALRTAAHPLYWLMYLLAALMVLFVVGWVIFFIDVIKRRANDIGWQPWLLTILTLVLPPMYIIIGCLPSMPTENKYGPVPAAGMHLNNDPARP